MKGSNAFKTTIENYLKSRASTDALFAETFKKPNKNIDDCITFIMNTVKASGENGFADDEIFNMAVHYYDEDDIKVGDKIDFYFNSAHGNYYPSMWRVVNHRPKEQ